MRRALFAVCLALALGDAARPARDSFAASTEAAAQGRPRTLRPSNILAELRQHKARHPRLSAAALARHANALLARKGLDYNFDSCEIFPTPDSYRPADSESVTLVYQMFRADGRGVSFTLVADEYGGVCAECFMRLPALRVTKRGMTLVGGGAAYVLKRPASFKLDEAQLLDASMKRVLRSWHLPFQAIPVGISPDGRSIYLDFYEEYGLDELLLELSEDGRPRFRARSGTDLGRDEWVTDPPKNPEDDFEGYKRFRVGGRTHVVRFTGPCT
ncbi:MAG TPA: hypothetical protein VF570_02465 [Pyrinomonadaceae bacterium]|jgi:hypothetical protein